MAQKRLLIGISVLLLAIPIMIIFYSVWCYINLRHAYLHHAIFKYEANAIGESEIISLFESQPRVLPERVFVRHGSEENHIAVGFLLEKRAWESGIPFDLNEIGKELNLELLCFDCEESDMIFSDGEVQAK